MVTETMNLDLQARNLNSLVKLSEQFRDNMQAGAAAASGIKGPKAAKDTAAFKAGTQETLSPDELAGYGVARSTVGTGAASRDFAKQAQGLGGLVHLYATLAANLFAVSTAFNQLSKAADTTNMIRGLDQLGAASGRSLGSISKRIVELTDGALSMRDAMETTAKATSAGFSTKQIEALTNVAKKSSQALGLNMVDAMSRLTRATSKLEPELIDELGLMTKIGPATDAYAKSVGKASAALTDFEKRQAFLNAVIQEGNDKFGAIEIDANPYVKVTAALQNLLQTGLEVVNKVLMPIASFLAQSPTALAAALGLVVSTLVKQALPAIGAIRENAQKAEEMAKQVSSKRIKSAEETVAKIAQIEQASIKKTLADKLAAQDRAADEAVKIADEAQTRASDLLQSKKGKGAKLLGTLASTAITDITPEQLKQLDDLGAKTNKASEGYRDLSKAIKDAQKSHDEFFKIQAEADKAKTPEARAAAEKAAIDDLASKNRTYQKEVEARRKAEEKYAQYRIKTSAIENTQILGMKYAWSELGKDIAKAKESGQIGPMAAGWSKVSGAISIATTAALGFASAINTAFIVVGALTALFGILDAVFSKNTKQAEEFSSAIGKVEESVFTLNNTLELYSKGAFKNWFTVESINARSTALKDLVENLQTATAKLSASRDNRSGWDSIVNAGWGLIGKSEEQKAARNMAASLAGIIEAIDTSDARQAGIEKLNEIFGGGIKAGTKSEILQAIKNQVDPETAIVNINKATDALKVFTDTQNKAANAQVVANESLKTITLAYQDLGASLRISTPLANFATGILKEAKNIEDALKDPVNSIATLKKIASDPTKLSLLDSGDASRLSKELPNIEKHLVKIQQLRDTLRERQKAAAEAPNNPQRAQEVKDAKLVLDEAIKGSGAKIGAQFVGIFDSISLRMSKIIANEFDTAVRLANLSVLQAMASGLQGPGAATIQGNLKQQELDAQIQATKTMAELVIALERNTAIRQSESSDKATADQGKEAARLLSLPLMDFIKEFRKITAKSPAEQTNLDKGLISQLSNTYLNALGTAAKLQPLQAEKRKTTFETGIQESKADLAARQAAETAQIANAKTLLDIRKQSLASFNNENLAVFAQQDAEERVLRQKELQLPIEAALANLKEQELRLDGRKDEAAKKVLETAQNQVEYAKRSKDAQLEQFDAAKKLSAIDREAAANTKRLDNEYQLAQIQRDRAALSVTSEEHLISLYTEQGALSEKMALDANTEITKAKELLQVKQQLADLDRDRQAKLDAVSANREKALVGGNAAEIAAANEAASRQEADINKIYNERVSLINATLSENLKYYDSLNSIKSRQIEINTLTQDLTGIFGTFGESLGGLAKTFDEINAQQKTFVELQEKANKELEAARKAKESEDPATAKKAALDEMAAEKKISELKKASTKAELDNEIKVLASSKKLFKEKTTAFKVLDGLEKAGRAVRIANQLKDTATELFNIGKILAAKIFGIQAETTAEVASVGPTVAAEGTKNATKGTGAILSALNAPWPVNFVAGAVMAAIVASLIGGGKSTSIPAGVTAEDRQKTQGTGQSWKDGKMVDNGGGVFGDTSAKSESIGKSIEILKDTSVENLSYTNKMLEALLGIKDAIGGAATKLYSTLGITKGSAFGTQDTTSKTIGITGLFGKTSTTNIIDSGIKLIGSFNDLARGMSGTVQQYETLQNTVKKSGFLGIGSSTSTSYSEQFKNADSSITNAISDIFSHATEVFVSVGEKLGMTAVDVLSKLGNVKVDQLASLKGLTGDDLEKEFSAIISNILDTASSALFEDMKKYQKFGEGLLETVVRVVDANDKIKLSFDSIGKTYTNLSFDVTESLVTAAGGLSNFLDQVSYFKDNFLSETEKLKPVQDSVNKTLADMGYSAVKTRDQFKTLVNSLDLTDPAAQKTYAALMELAPAFIAVTDKMQELIDNNKELELSILNAINSEVTRSEVLRRSTEGMDAVTRAEYDRNQELEKQLATVTQYNDLQKQLVAAQDNLLSASEKLLATRTRERDTISDVNKPLYDLVNAYTDLKTANDTMASRLTSMQSAVNSLASAAESAAARVKSAGQALANGYKSAQDKSKSAAKATQTATANIAKGYLNAKAAVDNAMKQLASAQSSAAKAIRDSLRELATSIRDFIIETSTSELGINTPTQNIAALQSQFSALASAASGGDQVAMGKLTDVAQQLLTLSKDQSSSAMDYARTYGFVIGTLDRISSAAMAIAGPAEDDTQGQILDAMQQLTSANEDLLLWQKLINDNGIDANMYAESTASTIAQLQQDLTDARTEQASADADTTLWQDKLAAAGIDTAKFTEDTAAGIDKLIQDYQEAFEANTTAQAALLSAQELTKNYTFNTVTELQKLQILVDEYEQARKDAAKAQQIIDTTNTQAIVDAINNLGNTIINGAASSSVPTKSVIGNPDTGLDNKKVAQSIVTATTTSVVDSLAITDTNRYMGKSSNDYLYDFNNIAQFDEGTNYVPKTGYALIHEGEKIQPAGYNNDVEEAILAELKTLREEVAKLRMTNDATEYNTRKTKETLQQVTAGNDYLQTKAV